MEHAGGCRIASVRSHFLLWEPSSTWPQLETAGIALDSTLGYPDASGFRCGTSFPFPVFDVHAMRVGSVWEIPLMLMDTTFLRNGLLPAGEMLEAASQLAAAVSQCGGVLVVLWHNSIYRVEDPGRMDEYRALIDTLEGMGPLFLTLDDAVTRTRRGWDSGMR